MKLQFLTAATLALPLLVACSGGPSGASDVAQDDALTAAATSTPTTAQMNDLSILYPLAKSQNEFDKGYLAASEKGVGGALIPQKMFTSATHLPVNAPTGPLPPGASKTLTYASLRAVAVRLDPCFANVGPITDPSSCDNQLRVVFESASYASGGTTMFDGAVHAFYSLSRDEWTETLKEVMTLRAAQTGGTKDLGAVAVHPLMASQGLTGKFAQGLNAIVLKHAGSKNLIRFTVFQGSNLDTAWSFQKYDVHGSTAKLQPIVGLPDNGTSVTFAEGFGQDLGGTFAPEPASMEDLKLITNLANAQAATADQVQAAYDAALRTENPNFDSPNTVDCASCHMAEPSRVLVAEPKFGMKSDGDVNSFVADSKIAAKDLARTTPYTNKDGLNIHAFSYKDSEPMINQRVVNETAAILAYVNADVLTSTAQ